MSHGMACHNDLYKIMPYEGFYFICDHGKHRNTEQHNCGCNFVLKGQNTKYIQNRTLLQKHNSQRNSIMQRK